MPPELLRFSTLFRALGVKDAFGPVELVTALADLPRTGPLPPSQLSFAITLVRLLAAPVCAVLPPPAAGGREGPASDAGTHTLRELCIVLYCIVLFVCLLLHSTRSVSLGYSSTLLLQFT